MVNNQFSPSLPQRLPDPIFHLETNKIKPNPFQPRRVFDETALGELASSIREFGILHPIVVTKVETPTDSGTEVEYQLISGERRLMASKLAGLERIPAIIKSVPTDRERLELAIIENIQRENLNPIETARAYSKLQDQFGLTQREIAVRVGKSREAVANAIRLLNLPTQIQDALSQGKINESQARLMLMLPDLKEQQMLFDDLMLNNLSVRQLRSKILSKRGIAVPSEPVMPTMADAETMHIEEQLREALGTKVKVQKEGQGGKLTINYYSSEELQGIIDKLTKAKEAAEKQSVFAESSRMPAAPESLIAAPEMPSIQELSVAPPAEPMPQYEQDVPLYQVPEVSYEQPVSPYQQQPIEQYEQPTTQYEQPSALHELPSPLHELPSNGLAELPDLSEQKPDFIV